MSRSTRMFLLRSLWLTGTLTAVALVATPAAHGQNGERALLNRTGAPARSFAAYEVPGTPVSDGRVNGDHALLARFSPDLIAKAPEFGPLPSDTLAQMIDGAQALMGRRTTIKARRPNLSTSQ